MKECPKCKELNGENRNDCWKCHASLETVHTYEKICPKCGVKYSQREERCEQCGGPLSVYTPDYNHTVTPDAGCWLYVVAVIIPLVGIILGCVHIARGNDKLGKSLIITGIVVSVVFGILTSVLSNL